MSRSQAHPRVTGCEGADHEKLKTLEAACNGMFQRGIKDFDMPIKNSAKRDTMSVNMGKHWAVAGGRATGIFTDWKIGVQKKPSKGQKPAMRLLAPKKKQKVLLQVGKMPSLTYRDWPSDKH
ncbi:hypothetical protein N7536_009579 [Penicillium majusculum]|uniref:Uncharacterized protein n=1 Tax=Penicillium solitum TaxID=60172 RepID=A0A1V6R9T2_9EURO|nr:uncharacterized protein PENSOL_c010G06820 [Penicillium solitum]KAJ5686960.1 hypothetical protein N7536_009579 [Penicillium majusculum]OQD97996.1 hypothetical protein PENSOL_c010G06820 [Penicillium solitum]